MPQSIGNVLLVGSVPPDLAEEVCKTCVTGYYTGVIARAGIERVVEPSIFDSVAVAPRPFSTR